MILSICPNPSIDCTIELDTLNVGKLNRAQNKIETYSGKALNFAIGISRLGENFFATGLMFENNGKLFEHTLEKEVSRNIGLLHTFQTVHYQKKAHDPDNGNEHRLIIKTGYQRRCQKNEQIQRKTHEHIEEENCGKIDLIRFLLLYQRCAQATVNKDLQNCNKNRNQGHSAINIRVEDAGKDDGDNEADSLRSKHLTKAPY